MSIVVKFFINFMRKRDAKTKSENKKGDASLLAGKLVIFPERNKEGFVLTFIII